MSNGLALTREPKANKNELLFYVEDSNGELITIKQTIRSIKGQQVRVSISAPDSVKISRGELENSTLSR
jgi:sRNA-binding carbon storage regulator CsrA